MTTIKKPVYAHTYIHLQIQCRKANLEVFAVIFADGLVLLGSLPYMVSEDDFGWQSNSSVGPYLDLVHHFSPHVPHGHLPVFADRFGLRKGEEKMLGK